MRAASEEVERVSQLLAAGAVPARKLKEAEDRLQEAKEAVILDKLLYGEVKVEDLTESQAAEMVTVSGRFEQREKIRLDEAAKMVELGMRPKNSLEPFTEGLARAQRTVAVAKSRASLVEELVSLVRAEQEAAAHEEIGRAHV